MNLLYYVSSIIAEIVYCCHSMLNVRFAKYILLLFMDRAAEAFRAGGMASELASDKVYTLR